MLGAICATCTVINYPCSHLVIKMNYKQLVKNHSEHKLSVTFIFLVEMFSKTSQLYEQTAQKNPEFFLLLFEK